MLALMMAVRKRNLKNTEDIVDKDGIVYCQRLRGCDIISAGENQAMPEEIS